MNPQHPTFPRQRTTGARPLLAAAAMAFAALGLQLPLRAEEKKPEPAAAPSAVSAEDQLAAATAHHEKASDLYAQGTEAICCSGGAAAKRGTAVPAVGTAGILPAASHPAGVTPVGPTGRMPVPRFAADSSPGATVAALCACHSNPSL